MLDNSSCLDRIQLRVKRVVTKSVTCLIVVLFVFKMHKTLGDQILTLRERDVILVEDESVLPYLIFLLLDMFV